MGRNKLVMTIIFMVAVLCTACSSGEAGKELAERDGAAAKTEEKKEKRRFSLLKFLKETMNNNLTGLEAKAAEEADESQE